jgi:peroxiredoxin
MPAKWVILFIVGLTVALLVGLTQVPPPTGLQPGQSAPPLEGKDTQGRLVRLQDYRGKVVVVNFWATWCGPCRKLIPHERELVAKFADRPFAFIGVSADHDLADLQEFLSKQKLPWPNIFDEGNILVRAWEIEYFPSIFVIDQAGVIRYRDVTGSKLEQAVSSLLGNS